MKTVERIEQEISQLSPQELARFRAWYSGFDAELFTAAAHDTWMRAQINQGVQEADAPATRWLSNEEVKEESAKRRIAWQQRAAASDNEGDA